MKLGTVPVNGGGVAELVDGAGGTAPVRGGGVKGGEATGGVVTGGGGYRRHRAHRLGCRGRGRGGDMGDGGGRRRECGRSGRRGPGDGPRPSGPSHVGELDWGLESLRRWRVVGTGRY